MAADSDAGLTAVELVDVAGQEELRATLCVSAAHAILAGHFPGAALVPGVVLVDAVRRACEVAFARTLSLREVVDARFLRRLLPAETARLIARAVPVAHGLEVEGAWQGASGRIATFRLRLTGDA